MANIRLQYKRQKPKGASIEKSSMVWSNGEPPFGVKVDKLNEISKAAYPIVTDKLDVLLKELEQLGFDPHTATFTIALK